MDRTVSNLVREAIRAEKNKVNGNFHKNDKYNDNNNNNNNN